MAVRMTISIYATTTVRYARRGTSVPLTSTKVSARWMPTLSSVDVQWAELAPEAKRAAADLPWCATNIVCPSGGEVLSRRCGNYSSHHRSENCRSTGSFRDGCSSRRATGRTVNSSGCRARPPHRRPRQEWRACRCQLLKVGTSRRSARGWLRTRDLCPAVARSLCCGQASGWPVVLTRHSGGRFSHP